MMCVGGSLLVSITFRLVTAITSPLSPSLLSLSLSLSLSIQDNDQVLVEDRKELKLTKVLAVITSRLSL